MLCVVQGCGGLEKMDLEECVMVSIWTLSVMFIVVWSKLWLLQMQILTHLKRYASIWCPTGCNHVQCYSLADLEGNPFQIFKKSP